MNRPALPRPAVPHLCLRRRSVAAGALLASLPLWLAPAGARAADARPDGGAAARPPDLADHEPPADRYAAHDLDWVDDARQRLVPVRLYLPQAATAAQRVPLVVFSHGIGGSRAGYTYLGRGWASQGYASLHVQHVGSDRQLWRGSLWSVFDRLRGAASENEAIDRAHDLRFALDRLLHSDWAPRIDGERIVAAGHSYGANTTLLVAGAQVERAGRRLDFRDPRIKGAIVISAPPFYGERDPAAVLGGVSVPSLHVTSTEDVIRIPGFYSGSEDRVSVFEATGSRRKTLAVFTGGSHSMFTDRPGTGGAWLNPQVKAATRALSLAFLHDVFGGDSAPLNEWPSRYGSIVSRFVRAAP